MNLIIKYILEVIFFLNKRYYNDKITFLYFLNKK
jgi:hypothetical protein